MPVAVLNVRTPPTEKANIVRIGKRNQDLAYEAMYETVLLYKPRDNTKAGYCGTADLIDIRIDVLAPRFIFVELRNIKLFPALLPTSPVDEPFEAMAYDEQLRPIFHYFSLGIRPLSILDRDVIERQTWHAESFQEEQQAPFGQLDRARATKEYAVRDSKLRNEALLHYGPRCAVCRRDYGDSERGLYEVEVSHLRSVELGGSDEIDNAMPKCRLHHWAYDKGLFTMTSDGDFLFGSRMTAELRAEFRGHRSAVLPDDPRAWPKAENIEAHRTLVFRG